MEKSNNKIKVSLITIIVITIALVLIVLGIISITSNKSDINYNKIENILSNTNQKSNYESNEKYTDFSYYYLTVMDSSYSGWYSDLSGYDYDNILKEVKYVRYIYQDNNWVLAENKNNSPFFSQTGNGIIVNSENYYIPVYELEEGKNKVVVTEITNGGTKKEKEYIINRTPSEYDNMYQVKPINKSDTLSLDTYQDEINVNMNDYNDILLTGSFFSNHEIKDITWTRYEHENNSKDWKIIPESQTNRTFYQSEGKAKIIGNYWVIDILHTDFDGEKIDITITDLSDAKITKTVYVNNTSSPMDFDLGRPKINEENITIDNGIRYVNNEVLLLFNSNVEEARCKEIINEINGKIMSSIGVVKEYDVQINQKFTTYSSIKEYCQKLEETYEEIIDASVNLLTKIDIN